MGVSIRVYMCVGGVRFCSKYRKVSLVAADLSLFFFSFGFSDDAKTHDAKLNPADHTRYLSAFTLLDMPRLSCAKISDICGLPIVPTLGLGLRLGISRTIPWCQPLLCTVPVEAPGNIATLILDWSPHRPQP